MKPLHDTTRVRNMIQKQKTYDQMRPVNIPADARVQAGCETYETARQFVDELRAHGRLVCTEEDGPETLRLPCDAIRDGNPQGFTLFVTDTYEHGDIFEGCVHVIWAFTPEETEGREEDPQSWPWDTAYFEIEHDDDVCPDVRAVWTFIDTTDLDRLVEETYWSEEGAVRDAEYAWYSLTDKARRSCVCSREHVFLVLDPLGMTVRDYGEDFGRLIARRHAEEVEDIPSLSALLTVLANQRGHEWVDSAYALADAWDGTETVPVLMKQYDMDADEANDMLDALTAIRVIAQKEKEESE